jgi:predicted phosphodiesterase
MAQAMPAPLKIVCISDTHACHELTEVPDGDILVHAGDVTRKGSLEDVESFDSWWAISRTGTKS